MTALERLDTLRRRMLLMVGALTLPAAVFYGWFADGPIKAAWLLSFGATVAWLAFQSPRSPRWKSLFPMTLVIALSPVCCALEPYSLVQLATLCLVPVIAAVLFIDSFDVVVCASVVGWVADTFFFAGLGWSVGDVAMLALSTGAVSLGVVAAAAGARRFRQLEVEIETQHSNALRLSETRRAQAERLAIVGRLASGVAHEINNPLAFVKANVGVLRRALLLGEERLEDGELEEILHDTTQGVDRICQIVADLKGFAREDAGVAEPVDLSESIHGAARLAMVRLPRDMKVNIDVPAGLPMVRANPRKLSQVMLNLLVNAGEALEEVRTLKPVVSISAVVEAELMKVTVTDNGPGIPPEVMNRLFEPFFTTKAPGKGTGLGLALSREYVTSFGGTLQVNNVEPHGAQFVITLKVTAVTGETPVPGSLSLGAQRAMFAARFRRKAS